MATSLTVRMYNQQNLGDCFLLKFQEATKTSWMLIDFGSYVSGNEEREKEIALDIIKTVKSAPITIVLTHQHKDHLTGFISAFELLKELKVEDLWFSYLDDPTGKEGKAMRKVTESFWKKNSEAKKKAKNKFNGEPAVEKMIKAKDAIDLFGEEQSGGEAITNLLALCGKKPRFLVPGQQFSLPRLPDDSVRVFVMGPPTDPKLLRKLNPSKGDAVHHLNALAGMINLDTSANLMLDALSAVSPEPNSDSTDNFPFSINYSRGLNDPLAEPLTRKEYVDTENEWRRIDFEWLSELGRLSLHMGNLTNNSSLVLAFELVKQQKVALFVADAQIGNWKSWGTIKFDNTETDAIDLLSRTVFYKAGHHSSHNATLSEYLDLMDEDELVIMIPVNEKVSKKMEFRMLELGMMKGYNRKSKGRVLRADTVFHTPRTSNSFAHKFAIQETDFKPKIKVVNDKLEEDHLYIEYVIK